MRPGCLPHRTGKRTEMTPSTLSEPDALARLRAIRIVPVITIDDPDDAVPLARALHDGGLVVRRDHVSHAARAARRFDASRLKCRRCSSERERC